MPRFCYLAVLLTMAPALPALMVQAAWADQVTVTNSSVYVTKSDCAALIEHRPAPDVAYKAGSDVHGKYVAPADLPGNDFSNVVPGKVQFEVKVNPLAYGQGQGAGPPAKYANTALPVARVEIDMKTGQASLNGKPLTGAQDQALWEACRKAGLR